MPAPSPRALAFLLLWLLVNPGKGAYDHIVEEYCHPTLDWGPLPERPAGVSKLLQVQVFIRHGARVQANTEKCWPEDKGGFFNCSLNYLVSSANGKDATMSTPVFQVQYMPGRNSIPGNCMTGQLVSAGFSQEVANGKRLREAYVDREQLMPGALEPLTAEALNATFFLRSTDVPRTKQSGTALFSGIYPAFAHTVEPPHLQLRTMDMTRENMLVNPKNCPGVTAATMEFHRTYPNGNDVESLCNELGKPTNATPESRLNCMIFLGYQVDCLMSRFCPTVPFHPRSNSTIPSRYLEEDAQLFRRIWKVMDELQWAYFIAMRRIGFGSFVQEVLTTATAAVDGHTHVQPFVLWSGHDTGPMEPMWAAFNLRDAPPYWPPFASMLVLEVWNSSSGPQVRWLSNGAVVGGGLWPWAKFQRHAQDLVPTEDECKGKSACAETQTERLYGVQGWLPYHWNERASSARITALLAGGGLALMSLVAWKLMCRQGSARGGRGHSTCAE